MEKHERKDHWEKVFKEKKLTEVSWYQSRPVTSIDMIHSSGLPKEASIIDIGSGDSFLIDYLLDEGYTNLYVLDISATALERAKARLGKKAARVHWIVSDVLDFMSEVKFDFWHDRAAFHFLTDAKDIARYVEIVKQNVKGYLSIGTFSDKGPLKCSGLEIKQYSEDMLSQRFQEAFNKVKCLNEKHTTPAQSVQEFTFCLFKKKLDK
jgi:SAM-dependent methyltransferase